ATQAGFRNSDCGVAGRSVEGFSARTIAVFAARSETTSPCAWATAVDLIDVGAVGQTLGSEIMKPAVTVLMAVYDSPLGMLDQAIESIQDQTFPDFEFLIIDDGSRDPKVR